MDDLTKAQKIIQLMFDQDEFSKWLDIKIINSGIGSCELKMKVREEMCNGFKIAHGGITYSLSDSALAFASNSRGRKSVSIETSISHLATVNIGDELTVFAYEKSYSNKIGMYEVEIKNQKNDLVSHFKGTVYRTSKEWEI